MEVINHKEAIDYIDDIVGKDMDILERVISTEDREEYMKSLDKASTEGELDEFIELVAEAVNRSLDTYLYIIGSL